MISCFNLMGVATHCETEYSVSRYFYETALKIAQENDGLPYYAYEYNNITLTYIAEENYEAALQSILSAQAHLQESDNEMGAYVYLNMSLVYQKLGKLAEALDAYERCVDVYHAEEILPDDTLLCGATLFFRLGRMEEYEARKQQILLKLNDMYAAEFMDACRELFFCGMDSGDDALVNQILTSMNRYIQQYPKETKVGLMVSHLNYLFAKKQGDVTGIIDALEQNNAYKKLIIQESERKRVQSLNQYDRINRELQSAIESKERASQVKTQFLSNMSHDMRTPINGILGMLEIIRTNMENRARLEDCLKKIRLSADHLLSLVNDVLDMSKLEADSMVLLNEPFCLDEMCSETMELVTFQARDAGLRVFEEHDEISGLYVMGSALHLKKILVNLFSNSIKYNKTGGAIYTRLHVVKRTEKQIVCEFSIADTGIGMSEEFIAHKIFEPFVQGDASARSSYAGTGLGLSIVKGLVEKMNGSIAVKSEIGVGSSFVVTIPFELTQKPEEAAPRAVTAPVRLSGVRLLLAEDNDLNAEIAQMLLENEGASITRVTDGQQAVTLFDSSAANTFDAILMDVMMPVMDGLEATKAIRALPRPDAASIPIIAMTANAFREDIHRCLDAGMNAHLAKPLDMEKVKYTIYSQVKSKT